MSNKEYKRDHVDYRLETGTALSGPKELSADGRIVDKRSKDHAPRYDANGLPIRNKRNGVIR